MKDIPSISDYSGWNEEAAAVWWAENKYDMEHWDEPDEEPDEGFWPEDEEEDEPEPDLPGCTFCGGEGHYATAHDQSEVW